MLQSAARARALLPDLAAARAFLAGRLDESGLYRDRAGRGDLYYTVFGLQSSLALGDAPGAMPALSAGMSCLPAVARGLDAIDPAGLDLVHLCCLARCRALVSEPLSFGRGRPSGPGEGEVSPRDSSTPEGEGFRARLESYRSADGGYALNPGAESGSVYACFMALGAYQDLDVAIPRPEGLISCVQSLRLADGSYANDRTIPIGNVPATAAAIIVLAEPGLTFDAAAGIQSGVTAAALHKSCDWLVNQCGPDGGFAVAPIVPSADLLSTSVALAALRRAGYDLSALNDRCRRFVLSLWDQRGCFRGTAEDDTLDTEYAWYGLLALGCLNG